MEKEAAITLRQGAETLGVALGEDQEALFAAYHRELILWNRRMNLISERTAREVVVRHFLDSLSAAPAVSPQGLLIDLGSGGGFPGVPLKIVYPRLDVFLVEASRKKCSFLNHLARTLGLKGVTVIRERVEILIGEQALKGRFDTVISRAAFKLPDLVKMAAFFLKPGGLLVAMKGQDVGEEMEEARGFLGPLKMSLAGLRDVPMAISNIQRKLIIYRLDSDRSGPEKNF